MKCFECVSRWVGVLLIVGLPQFVSSSEFEYLLGKPFGVRAMGMGNAFVAVSDDASAVYHNPAGLTQFQWSYVSVQMQKVFSTQYRGLAAFVDPAAGGEDWGYGLAARGLFVSGSLLDSTVGVSRARLSDKNIIGYLSVARKFGGDEGIFRLGMNVKFLYADLKSKASVGGGSDIGSLVFLPFLSVGVLVQDWLTLARSHSRQKTVYHAPILKIGLATRITEDDPWKFSLQFDKNLIAQESLSVRMGGSIRLWNASHALDRERASIHVENPAVVLQQFHEIKTHKQFPRAVFLNFGYEHQHLTLGFTFAWFNVKVDLAFSFAALHKHKTFTVGAAVDIALY